MSASPVKFGDVVCVGTETKTYRVDEIGSPGETEARRLAFDRPLKARLIPIIGHAVTWVAIDRLTVMPERPMVQAGREAAS